MGGNTSCLRTQHGDPSRDNDEVSTNDKADDPVVTLATDF